MGILLGVPCSSCCKWYLPCSASSAATLLLAASTFDSRSSRARGLTSASPPCSRASSRCPRWLRARRLVSRCPLSFAFAFWLPMLTVLRFRLSAALRCPIRPPASLFASCVPCLCHLPVCSPAGVVSRLVCVACLLSIACTFLYIRLSPPHARAHFVRHPRRSCPSLCPVSSRLAPSVCSPRCLLCVPLVRLRVACTVPASAASPACWFGARRRRCVRPPNRATWSCP